MRHLSLKKKKKFIVTLLLVISSIVIVSSGIIFLYIYMFQRVVNEGMVLAEERCRTVNPYAHARIKMYEQVNQKIFSTINPTEEELMDVNEMLWELKFKLKDEGNAQMDWYYKQRDFLYSWDTQLFTHKPLYTMMESELEYYRTENALNRVMVMWLEHPEDLTVQNELDKTFDRFKQADAAYKSAFQYAAENPDWRAKWITIPSYNCPEYMNVPSVTEEKKIFSS